ncbi:DUF5615 family PIN-like protein [Candidatus Nitrospira salsa]|nr:MAG: hypothetical protein NPIRA01_40250 [Nitrospirales bacterium]
MPDSLAVLLDQNIPRSIKIWLESIRPAWNITHTSDIGLSGKSDEEIFRWAQSQGCIIVTFDEDFADQRSFPVGTHPGIIRLRIWPTTAEETQKALKRLLTKVPDSELRESLVIIDRVNIRMRSRTERND